jgi:hypothetical protein
LFRAFRLAIDFKKLILAFCAILLCYCTGRFMDAVWPESCKAAQVTVGGRVDTELSRYVAADGGGCEAVHQWLDGLKDMPQGVKRVGPFAMILDHARNTVNALADSVMKGNCRGFASAARDGAMGKFWLLCVHPLYGIIFFIVVLIVWALFGGAICRAAALQATRDERPGLRETFAFAWKRFGSFIVAPLMPLAMVIFIGIFLYVAGLVGAIPGIGTVLAGILFFLAILVGFVIAFVLIGYWAGVSLMYPTIAVEGTDAFDAVSRSFSYVYQRPWRTAFYALVSLVYGAICLYFVKFFARLMLAATHFIVGLSMNLGSPTLATPEKPDQAIKTEQTVGKLDAMWQAPSLTGDTTFYGGFGNENLASASRFGQVFIHIWVYMVVAFVGAYALSFFFSATTLIYLLLRRDVDATDLDDVYVEERPEDLAAAPQSAAELGSTPPETPSAPETGPAPGV